MSDIIQSFIVSNFYLYTFNKGTVIYNEGAFGTLFFIVAEGNVKSVHQGECRFLKQFEHFGEACLFSNCKRDSTITAMTKVKLCVLDGLIFRECLHRIADEKYQERVDFLNSLSYFATLDNISKLILSDKMEYAMFLNGETIIQKNDIGTSMYVIKSGNVSCRINGVEIRKLSQMEYFGQNAVLFDVKRSLDVIAISDTVCYKITKNDLVEIFADEYKHKILQSMFKSIINSHNILKDIIIDSISDKIFNCFDIVLYKDNDSVVKGDDADKMVIVIDGDIVDNDVIVAKRNEIIGYEIIYDKTKALSPSLKARHDCITLECNAKKLNDIINIEFSTNKKYSTNNSINPIKMLSRIGKLQKSFIFSHLSKSTLEKLVFKMTKMKYAKNEIIVSENSSGNTFYLIAKGRVRVSKGGRFLRDLERGNCFGEIALLNKDTNRTATVIALDAKVVCYVLSKEDFDVIITDENTKAYLLRKISLQNDDVSLESLNVIKFLGKGKFGNVYLVHNNENVYAIKTVSRLAVNRQKMLAQYFINERRVMLTIDHPFIVKLVKTLKNNLFCFFLIEFINGISLDNHLIQSRKLNIIYNTNEVLFYIASLSLIIDYLHKKYIAHRDIKPSNIMIDVNGYIKLIDFGTAKVLKDYTSTVIGTPHYIAPEILRGKGYSMSCDYWSIGVCAYEIFYGIYPFGNKATDILEIYKEIINKKLMFPIVNNSKVNALEMNTFINGMLSKSVSNRICSLNGIKKEKIFESFKWDELIEFKMAAPFKPNPMVIGDLSRYKDKFETRVHKDFSSKGNFSYQVENGGKEFKNYDITWAYEF